jgi:hypothetical protein
MNTGSGNADVKRKSSTHNLYFQHSLITWFLPEAGTCRGSTPHTFGEKKNIFAKLKQICRPPRPAPNVWVKLGIRSSSSHPAYRGFWILLLYTFSRVWIRWYLLQGFGSDDTFSGFWIRDTFSRFWILLFSVSYYFRWKGFSPNKCKSRTKNLNSRVKSRNSGRKFYMNIIKFQKIHQKLGSHLYYTCTMYHYDINQNYTSSQNISKFYF